MFCILTQYLFTNGQNKIENKEWSQHLNKKLRLNKRYILTKLQYLGTIYKTWNSDKRYTGSIQAVFKYFREVYASRSAKLLGEWK